MDATAQFFVVGFVVVLALVSERADFLGKRILGLALGLDGFVSFFDGVHHLTFAHFLHLAFHHHNAVHGAGHHDVHVGDFQLRAQGVDDKLSVDAGHADFRHRSVKRNVGHGDGCARGETSQAVGEHFFVGAHQLDHDLCSSVVIAREQRTQCAVDESHHQHLSVGRTGLALKESSWETTSGRIFFAVIHGEWKEIHVHRFVAGHDGGQQHGVARADDHRTVSLLGELAGFNGDLAPIAEIDGLILNVHVASSSTCKRAGKPQ